MEKAAVTTEGQILAKGNLINTPLGAAHFMGILQCKGATVVMAHPLNHHYWSTFTPGQLGLTVEDVLVGELV